MIPARRAQRAGAALIIALVILAALMLLGLPFIFSQSGALAGTRSFARGQTAQVGMSAAENSGIGLAGNAAARHLLPGVAFGLPSDQEWSRIDWDLDTTYHPLPVGLTVNPVHVSYFDGLRYQIDWLNTPLASAPPPTDQPRRDLLGVSIEDEGGKLDPNHLDAAGWQRLLAAADVGIADVNDPADHDTYGQLAKALANLRFTLPGNRITDFSQLLGALPSGSVRQHLTKAELGHLRPHLSFSNRAPARAGLIDLGTVVLVESPPVSATIVPYLDSVPPARQLAFPVTPDLVGAGTVLVSQVGTATAQVSRLANGDLASNTTVTAPNSVVLTPLIANAALAIEAPPTVNIHEAMATTLATLRLPAVGTPALAAPLQMTNDTVDKLLGINALADARTAVGPPLTAFDLLDPLATYDELGTATVGPTVLGDGAGTPPFLDTDMTTPLVDQRAVRLHLQGGNFDRLPSVGYARIHGTHAGGSVPPITSPDEFISYTLAPISATTADLVNVTVVSLRPGTLATPASFRVEAGGPTITFIAPHEQSPVAITSSGVVTIDSSATVTDAKGSPDAKRGRRVVAQAVPQEVPLETRWTTQSQIHALLASRQGSLMTSFPNPVQRATDLPTSDAAVTPSGELPVGTGTPPVGEDQLTGLKPAILPALHGGQLDIVWSRTFAGTQGTGILNYWQSGLSAGLPAENPLGQVLTPEGVRMCVGDPLAYPNAIGGNGFIPFGNEQSSGNISTVAPFHFAIWIKPTVDLTDPAKYPNPNVTIFEMRMPAVNAGSPLPGTAVPGLPGPPSTDVQNRISLRYQMGMRQFSLILNNGAIEHLTTLGTKVRPEVFADPFTDPQCAGDSSSSDAVALAPGQGTVQIKLRYQMGPQGLQPNVWHLIQGAIGGNLPGGMALMVDGVIGREATRLSPVTLSQMGDHVTLPSLVLRTALTGTTPADNVGTMGASALTRTGDIDLEACTGSFSSETLDTGGAGVADMLPERGMIRVGQEFISYSGMTVASDHATLHHCVRARRQSTFATSTIDAERWPLLQDHALGDLVVPGGYRISPPGGSPRQLYRGGCTLTAPLADGLMPDGTTHLPKDLNQTALVTPVALQITDTTLTVSSGNVQRWPDHGMIYLAQTGELLSFGSRVETPPASGAYVLGQLQRARLGTTAQPIVLGSSIDPLVTLASLEVSWSDPADQGPLVPGRYKTNSGAKLIQLYDRVGGRCEWLTYTDIDVVEDTTGRHGYFVDRTNFFGYQPLDPVTNPDGSTSSRGSERTRFIPNSPDFAAGIDVLPVQTEMDACGYLINTGDVLTLAPRTLSPTTKPVQVCVRYAPLDGFSTTPGTVVDAHNHYFAFTTTLPEGTKWSFDPSNFAPYDLLCWPCWNSETDLSPYQPSDGLNPNKNAQLLPHTLMPWASSFQTGYTAPDARVYFGVLDDREYAGDAQLPGLIDMLQSGPMPPLRMLTTTTGTGTTWLTRTDGIPILNGIQINYPNATFPQVNGLVMIGNEVFAFERIDSPPPSVPLTVPQTTARLIGRSLLGTKAVDHTLYEKMIFLPIGPVRELATSMPVGATGHVSFSPLGAMDAPAYLICSPDGQDMELVSLPQLITAPWLRGMYGTTPHAWPTSAGTPLVIAWWPRYPSAFPHATGLAALLPSPSTAEQQASLQASLLRCRTYAWASFPVRFHDTYFADADPFLIDFPPGPPDSNVTISYAAMANGMSWNFGMFKSPYDTHGTLAHSSQLFAADPFLASGKAQPVDGAEVRVIWQYANPPYTGTDAVTFLTQAAANANQAPMLGTAKFQVRAPSKILAVVPP